MKILFLNTYADFATSGGGAEITIHNLTQGILRQGHEPVVLATSKKAGLEQSKLQGVRIFHAGLRNVYWPQQKVRQNPILRLLWHSVDSYNILMRPLLRQVLEAERPDVVSIHNLPGWSAAAWETIASTDIPIVQVLHDSYAICPKSTMYTQHGNCAGQCFSCRVLRLPHRRASNYVSAVVGVSQFILDRHLQEGYFAKVPIQRSIHNVRDPVDLGINTDIPRTRGSPFRIGYIGRIDHTKGVELLLNAFEKANMPDAELWIAGSGNKVYEDSLRVRWQTEKIRFMGHMSQRDFFPNVDVVVAPSLWQEPLGMVVAESLAFGKPIIASRRGGIPEMIQDGSNGVLFDPTKIDELVNAMHKLHNDEPFRKSMSLRAVDSALPFMNRNSWIAQYVEIYQQVLGVSNGTTTQSTEQ